MANNKDFKVKNGIQPTAYHEAVGTVTSGSENYNLTAASYDNVSLDVSSQTILPSDIFFKPDGTKMFTTGLSGSTYTINEYSLSTAYDLSTASFTQSFSTASQETTPRSIWFKDDGTKMFLLGAAGDDVNEYTLSTAWSLTSVSFVDSFSVASQDTAPYGLTFSADGTQMYTCGLVEDDVIQYTLSTAWDVSEASYTRNLVITTVEPNPRDVQFNSDGTVMFISGRTNGLHKYTLTTAYDISTATFDSTSSISTSTQSEPAGFFIKSDGSKMWVGDSTNKTIYQYSTVLTTNTLDLSTGSVFEITPSSSVKIDISNPSDSGTVSGATLILDGVAVSSYDIDLAEYDGVTLGVSNEEGTPSGIFFKPDGTKMYICGYTGDEVNEYDLSPPWDITSATALNVFSVSGQDTAPVGIAFKTDGTEMYMVGQAGDDVTQYTLSVAWDISSINPSAPVTASKALTGETTPEDVRFKPDGTKMYVCGSFTNAKISEYALSTAWDLSTATYTDTINISAQGSTPKSFDFNSEGTKVAVVFQNNDTVFEYDLSTAWDVSTATYNNVSIDVSTQAATPQGLIFKSNGEKMYIADSASVQVRQFNVSSAQTITYDSSIEWEGGSAPASPTIGATDVLTFITRDGGTSYQAKQVIDGAE